MSLAKCVGWALVLLALGYPHAAGRVLAALTVVGTVLLGHFAATCLLGAVGLVAGSVLRLYLRRRALRRFWLGGRW